jgi:hypothetical protein
MSEFLRLAETPASIIGAPTALAWASVRCGAWWREAGRGGGWRGAPPGRVAPRGRAALVFLHLNMQRNSGGRAAWLLRVCIAQ